MFQKGKNHSWRLGSWCTILEVQMLPIDSNCISIINWNNKQKTPSISYSDDVQSSRNQTIWWLIFRFSNPWNKNHKHHKEANSLSMTYQALHVFKPHWIHVWYILYLHVPSFTIKSIKCRSICRDPMGMFTFTNNIWGPVKIYYQLPNMTLICLLGEQRPCSIILSHIGTSRLNVRFFWLWLMSTFFDHPTSHPTFLKYTAWVRSGLYPNSIQKGFRDSQAFCCSHFCSIKMHHSQLNKAVSEILFIKLNILQ